MNTLDKWFDRIYSETDVSRSIATSIAGVIGLVTYLISRDWVISVLGFVVLFPVLRLLAALRHERLKATSDRLRDEMRADELYSSLSPGERLVVDAFVVQGGSAMSWSQFNSSDLSASAIETLIQRDVLWPSMTADGLTETFALDIGLYDAGVRRSTRYARTSPMDNIEDE